MAEKTEEDLLFQEIDEEMRQDQATKLWQAYGKHVIAGTILLVVAVAGFQGWKAYDISTREADGERFSKAQAMVQTDQEEAGLKAFADIAADGRAGYALLARFQQARLLARAGDAAGAAAAYQALSEDGGIDPTYRDLAVILGGLQELNAAGADLAALESRLEPLMAETSSWRFSAREIKGLLAHRSGNASGARKLFQGLANDPRAPQGIRLRAQEMLSILGK